MASILRYGSYVPLFRLRRDRLSPAGRGERAVAGFDEDATSLAVEAAREALRGCPGSPRTVLFASTSHAYGEKLNGAAVQAALDLPSGVRALDVASSASAGLASLGLAAGIADDGPTLVCASDVVVGAPFGPREAAGGDGASAFLVGPADSGGVARILASATNTLEILDVWRGREQPFARQWEERFALQGLVPALAESLEEALRRAGLKVADLDAIAVDAGHPKAAAPLARAAGLRPGQLADDLSAVVGRCGAAHAGVLLAALLDEARPGDRLAVLSAGDGASALVAEASAGIADLRPRRSVRRWVASKVADVPHRTYLKWRGVLPFEPPRRPDPPRPAAPPMRRSLRWKYALVGARCLDCGAAGLPPQRVCPACGALDRGEDVPYADARARVATYTLDHLAYSLQQPVVSAIVDFDIGGRLACELADVDPPRVAIGLELEMTFRCLYKADGVRNYFWKARPRRRAEAASKPASRLPG